MGVDLEGKVVKCVSVLDPGVVYDVPYDKLVIGIGAVSNDFKIPGVKEHAFFLKVCGCGLRVPWGICGVVSRGYVGVACRYHRAMWMWPAGITGICGCGLQVSQGYVGVACRYHRAMWVWPAGITQGYVGVACRYHRDLTQNVLILISCQPTVKANVSCHLTVGCHHLINKCQLSSQYLAVIIINKCQLSSQCLAVILSFCCHLNVWLSCKCPLSSELQISVCERDRAH